MKRNILFFGIISLLIFACGKDKKVYCYRNLTQTEIDRLVYNGGEILIFKSNSSVFDTLHVTPRQNLTLKVQGCDDQRQYIKIYLTSDSAKMLDNSWVNMLFILAPSSGSPEEYPTIDIDGNFQLSSSLVSITMTINNKSVSGLRVLGPLSSTHPVQKIYWHYTYGILRIEKLNGEIWERTNF